MCDSKLPRLQASNLEDEAIWIFFCLILQGKIHEAVWFEQDAGNGISVMEILQSKHPDQSEPHPDAFLVLMLYQL